VLLASGAEQPVPIASLTKIMTADVVLRDHPLAPGAQGPAVTISASDQKEAYEEVEADDSSIPVQAGEVLSERQLLDGLLVHSANNFGDVLARWDAGSVAAFVSKMNATAASLNMSETHYVDSAGIDARSVSTAVDELRVASAAMSIPTFAAVVAQPTITLPIAGTLANYVSQVGSDGIVGVKSGFTQAAMGCLVLAAQHQIDGHRVLVMAAVTDQPGFHPLDAAARATLPLIDATVASLKSESVTPGDRRVATVTTPWSSTVVAGTTAGSVSVVVWPGDTVRHSMRRAQVRGGAPAGTMLGTMEVSVGSERVKIPVRSVSSIPGPSLVWRLTRL
jgi:D-alanyl-D-alanine carboxypeptidase (penicillin-binding protein 5/6)